MLLSRVDCNLFNRPNSQISSKSSRVGRAPNVVKDSFLSSPFDAYGLGLFVIKTTCLHYLLFAWLKDQTKKLSLDTSFKQKHGMVKAISSLNGTH